MANKRRGALVALVIGLLILFILVAAAIYNAVTAQPLDASMPGAVPAHVVRSGWPSGWSSDCCNRDPSSPWLTGASHAVTPAVPDVTFMG